MTSFMRACAVLALASASGCYHFTFELRDQSERAVLDEGETELVTYQERVPTWLNGFLGEGTVDTSKYCDQPVRTELRVLPEDVLLSALTLLIYTPHTLYVTCEVPRGDVATTR